MTHKNKAAHFRIGPGGQRSDRSDGLTLITAPAPGPVMVPDPALVREIELSYGNRRQRKAYDAMMRKRAVQGKTVLKDRERDADGHLLPVHPHDRQKGPK